MLRNYLKTALRNLWRYKGFSFINILSLTIGIIGCLVIGLFIWDENKFDKSIADGDRIYRLYEEGKESSNSFFIASVSPAYAPFAKREYPEVDTTLRILMARDKFLLEVGERRGYEEKGWFAEPSIFHMFGLKLSRGDANTALKDPGTIVISEELAKRYFGNEDPVGKTIKFDKEDLAVKGVFAKLPDHFHLDFHYLVSLPTAGIPPNNMENWGWHQFYTYIKLVPGADPVALQKKLQTHVIRNIQPKEEQTESSYLPHLQPLHDIHLNSSDFVYDNAIRGNASYVKGLSIIALFVLGIACFNFINLATARSFRRAKEIGVRKVIGAGKKQLILQFISETILLSLIAVSMAVIATWFIVPALNTFSGKNIAFNPLTDPSLALTILAAAFIIGIIAGLYPAFVLSGFQPIKVLKGSGTSVAGKNGWLRQSLVVVQFALSTLLIVSSIIVYRQVKFLNTRDLGFNKEQVIYFQVRDSIERNVEVFKQELKSSPDVVSVTSGYGLPGDQFAGDGIAIPGKNGDKQYATKLFIGDHDFPKTLGMKIVAGRDFSRDISTDAEEGFLINETAVKDFGFGTPENAIGQRISWDKWGDTVNPVKHGRIIGVVKDFHYSSLHEKVASAVILIYPRQQFKIAVKVQTANMKNTLAFINSTWNRFVPGYPLDYKFMDETYGKMYRSEEDLGDLLLIFTIMAIVVGCMGLFALAAFSTEQRIKEIGIRKVLGAGVLNLTALLSGSFMRLVLIATIIAFPLAWWALNNWLEDFPYRITISPWIFAIAAVASLTIALLTVSLQTVKAAMSNPVKNLRTE